MQLAVRMPDHLVSMLDEHVDGVRYRSRAQLITIIISDWLDKKEKEYLNMAALENSTYITNAALLLNACRLKELSFDEYMARTNGLVLKYKKLLLGLSPQEFFDLTGLVMKRADDLMCLERSV